MRRKREIFILWVHDDLSRVVVPILELELKRRGLKVVRDSTLKTSNTASLPQWMANNIENLVVICVVTPELAKWFNPGTEAPAQKHLGVQWEIRQLIQRMYEHGSREGCPVIPVLPSGVAAEDGPMILRALENTPFDHVTGEGINDIVQRVQDAYDHPQLAADGRRAAEDKAQPSTQPWDGLTEQLRHVDPSLEDAREISEAWIKRALKKGVSHSSALLRVFKKIRLVAHYAGDLVLLEQITDICLKALEQLHLDDEIRAEKCTYLLNRSFLLFCHHEVRMAQTVAEQARALASDAKEPMLIAMAERCLAFIHVRLAEFSSGDARADEVAQARTYALSAMNNFKAVDSEDKYLALLAMAEVHLAEHRYERDQRSLDEAARLSDEAAKGFLDQRFHWYYEARLLQAEVASEKGKTAAANKLLGEMLCHLRSRVESAEAFTESLGKAHLLRARLWVTLGRADAQTEIGEARAVFDKLNLQRMVAECEWLSFRCERKRHRFSAYDIKALERLCPDPVFRIEVAQRGRTWPAVWGLPGRIGDRNWKRAIQETLAERGRR